MHPGHTVCVAVKVLKTVNSDSISLPQRVTRVPRKLPSLTPVPRRSPKNTSTQSTGIPITTHSPLVTSLRKAFMDTPLHVTDTMDPLLEPGPTPTMPILQVMELEKGASNYKANFSSMAASLNRQDLSDSGEETEIYYRDG